jgi:2-polyprenyl-3-methyl-5-hydroxy-6-metoxy-1,4-benzoquinol methylase
MKGPLRRLQSMALNLDRETQYVMHQVQASCAASGRRVLDVGCGFGRFLDQMRDAGLDATGVDINPQIVAANRKAGLRCLSADEFVASRDLYDVLLMAHVIEHFAPRELLQFMDSYLDRLRPGGRLIIATPLLSDYFYDDFDHIRPYQVAGIQMVFGEGTAQVQYYSRNKLALRDLWFRRSAARVSHSRARYLPGRWGLVIASLDLAAAAVFLLSGRRIGKANGWVGVFEKTGGSR